MSQSMMLAYYDRTKPVVLQTDYSKDVQKKLQQRQANAAKQYDMTAKVKGELIVGQHVRLLNKATRRWEPAVVSGVADTPRSYYVKRLGGGEPLRRNRVDIRPTRETFQNFQWQSATNEEE